MTQTAHPCAASGCRQRLWAIGATFERAYGLAFPGKAEWIKPRSVGPRYGDHTFLLKCFILAKSARKQSVAPMSAKSPCPGAARRCAAAFGLYSAQVHSLIVHNAPIRHTAYQPKIKGRASLRGLFASRSLAYSAGTASALLGAPKWRRFRCSTSQIIASCEASATAVSAQ
ncbi:hypothetical protein BD293_1854 [Roseinatronobacter monicus]|uniref:Uncharacterized protein n=1 Tax=Roseinatronobacter monicus TaxID=393481 RepID=A0A543KDW3_9RHOB|nr:hypothetical protein BD293_1854 [Roseinatronobacter monicus]